jgi:hypothetical protein
MTSPTAINNRGQIVGIVQGLGTNMGFFKDGASFSLISVPGAGPLNGTVASGINDSAQVVGSYTTEGASVVPMGMRRRAKRLRPLMYQGQAIRVRMISTILGSGSTGLESGSTALCYERNASLGYHHKSRRQFLLPLASAVATAS